MNSSSSLGPLIMWVTSAHRVPTLFRCYRGTQLMINGRFASPRATTVISALLSLAASSWIVTADAAAPAAQPQFHAFKIGSDKAVALKDGDIQEPNDGKSFVV